MSKFWQRVATEYVTRRKEESVSEEKRIYVIVAETVDTPNGVVIQPCGRIAAQCAHVVSKMRMEYARETGNLLFKPFTTIVLAAPSNRELHDLICELTEEQDVAAASFFDRNEEAYGRRFRCMTAICTHPVEKLDLNGVLDHLPLWSHSRDVAESIKDVARVLSAPMPSELETA